jgi:glycopeptide antibiotics resistance protein
LPLFGFDVFPWYSYFAVAIAGVLFTTRVFTNRSVYALVGMALSLYLIARLGQLIADPSSVSFQTTITAMILIVLGSYIGFLTAKIFEKALHNFFLIPNRHAS